MSAFGVVVGRGGDPTREMMTRMGNALRLHGPDRAGQRILDGVGLVSSLMLGFTPQDRFERQPVQAAGRFHLVLAGWISNRAEMIDLLQVEPGGAETMPDSALALAAWERWQTGALDRLDGDFALALWDEETRALVCARSILQAPPVHYHADRHRVAIATFPKGIFALGDVERELDEVAIADSLVLNYEDVERSYFRDIKRLPLGCYMRVDADGLTVTRYWDPDRAPDVRFKNDRDYVDAANELFFSATRDCLRATETPAVSLSSGLDSPSVAVSAIEVLRAQGGSGAFPVVGFTSVPESGWDGRTYGADWAGDESEPVRALGRMYPELEVNFLDSAGQDIDAHLDQLFLLGEVPPRNNGNLYWAIDIAKAVRARGKRVLLTGFNGNGTFSLEGGTRFPMLLKSGRLVELARELRASAGPRSRFGSVFKKAIAPLLPQDAYRTIMRWRGLMDDVPWRSVSAITDEWAGHMKVEQRLQQFGFDPTYQPHATLRSYIKTIQVGGTRDVGQAVGQAIEALTGVQTRDPFADRRISEFCLGLPVEQYLYRGTDRRLIRRMMADRLPKHVLDAPRGRQGADWHLRMTRRLPAYREELDRLAADPDVAGRVDVDRLRNVLETWPEKTPLGQADHPDHLMAWFGMGRAIGTARYIRWVKGANR